VPPPAQGWCKMLEVDNALRFREYPSRFLAVFAALDSINPNAMAVQIYLLSTPSPVVASIAFIVGDFAAACWSLISIRE